MKKPLFSFLPSVGRRFTPNTIVLGLIYFLLLTPFGFLRRKMGYSRLWENSIEGKSSEWTVLPISREASAESLRKQF